MKAEVTLPAIFGDNMVLQRDQELKVWGWDNPGQAVTVTIAGQNAAAKAAQDGRWEAKLKPLSVTAHPLRMVVKGSSTRTLTNILVGEVWLCSGQSNMQWTVNSSVDPDLETASANYPRMRIITVPQVGTQEPQKDFDGQWEPVTPETVGDFSAVGYFYGRMLHQVLDVPVGLIDNAWGGSACEAWVPRDVLRKEGFTDLLAQWEKTEATFDWEKQQADYQKRLDDWKAVAAKARAEKKAPPRAPTPPRNVLAGQHRPANLYNGVLKPVIGFGIRGAIWYQGESNALRAWEYRKLFPTMISTWRQEWGQGDFPFYWVQLADFKPEAEDPADSGWAELREAQTMTMSTLPNTGEAVILNLGEASDIHPKNKQDVGKRLARWALAKDYGHAKLPHRSPLYKSMEKKGNKIVLSFDHVGGGLDTFDVNEPLGFAIAGPDHTFVWAQAKIVGAGRNQIEVWSDSVADPVAVRYAWADNPVCNVQNTVGLPLTPFRTDDFPMLTHPDAGEAEPKPEAPAIKTTGPAEKKAAPAPAPAPASTPANPAPAKAETKEKAAAVN